MRTRVSLRREEERKGSLGRPRAQPTASASRSRSGIGQPSPGRASLLLAQRALGNRWVQRYVVPSGWMILRDPKKPEPDKSAPPAKAATRTVDVAASKDVGPQAVVLITPAAATALAGQNPEVHVLLHYHGHTGGYGDPGGVGTQRAAWDQIGPQIEATGRPVIAILPQAGIRADKSWGFGKAASQPTEYIAGVMARLTTQEKWAATPKYTVAVSGHSGGGFPAAQAVAQGLKAEEVMLLDGINGFRELTSIITWVHSRLDDAASRSRPRAPTRPNRTRHWRARCGSAPSTTGANSIRRKTKSTSPSRSRRTAMPSATAAMRDGTRLSRIASTSGSPTTAPSLARRW